MIKESILSLRDMTPAEIERAIREYGSHSLKDADCSIWAILLNEGAFTYRYSNTFNVDRSDFRSGSLTIYARRFIG